MENEYSDKNFMSGSTEGDVESEKKRKKSLAEGLVIKPPLSRLRSATEIPFHVPHKRLYDHSRTDYEEERVEPLAGYLKNQTARRKGKTKTIIIEPEASQVQELYKKKSRIIPPATKDKGIKDNLAKNEVGIIDHKTLIEHIKKKKDHSFLYIKHPYPKWSPLFNFYQFEVVPYSRVDKTHYFTISSHGVTEFSGNKMEMTPINIWERDYELYSKFIKVKMFEKFHLITTFFWWQKNMRLTKFYLARKELSKLLFPLNLHLREVSLKYQKICQPLMALSLVKFSGNVTSTLEKFLAMQEENIKDIGETLHSLQDYLSTIILEACKSALWSKGYTINDSNFDLTKTDSPLKYKQANKMSYIHQANKRLCCSRLSCFINLTDYYMINLLFNIMRNSLNEVENTLKTHSEALMEGQHEEFDDNSGHQRGRDEQEEDVEFLEETKREKSKDASELEPLFEVDVLLDSTSVYLVPSEGEFMTRINKIIDEWAEVVTEISPLLNESVSQTYTQPMINGKLEERLIGHGPCLANILKNDAGLRESRIRIDSLLKSNFDHAHKLLEKYELIREFFAENEKTQFEDIKQQKEPEFFRQMLSNIYEQQSILKAAEDYQHVGMFLLKFETFKEITVPSPQRLLEAVNIVLQWIGKSKIDSLTSEVMDAIAYLDVPPKTTADYVEYLEFLDKESTRVDDMEHEMEYAKEIYDLIEDFEVPCSADDISNYSSFGVTLASFRNMVDAKISDKGKIIVQFNDQLNKDINNLLSEVVDVKEAIMQPMLIDINSNPEEVKLMLNELNEKLKECKRKANEYKGYQKTIKVEVTKYDVLDEALNDVFLRQLLWRSVDEWNTRMEQWSSQNFNTLDPEEMSNITFKHLKYVQQFEKGLPENLIVPKLKANVEQMKDKLPVIFNLRNPALKARHWIKIENVLDHKFRPEETLTLQLLEDLDAFSKKSELEEISGQASSEASLDGILKKVEDAWKSLEFIVLPYKDTKDVYVLGGLEDIQTVLDESHININTIASSKHVGPLKFRVDEWINKLDLFSKTLEEWQTCQQNWIYLESIFSAPDIQRQLPAESKMFTTVDKSWKEIMRNVAKIPLAMPACTKPGLVDAIQANNMLLDQIMKCLEAYLESKRVVFPRFYFLSNEELLEILAQTKNPHAVQPHLRKCFDAIAKLEFGTLTTPDGKVALTTDIVAMISPEGERVALGSGLKARGNVEEWLLKVEDSMFLALKKRMKLAIIDFSGKRSREEWIQSHPSQVVLTVSQVMWCKNVHMVLESKNAQNELVAFEVLSFEELNELAALVRGDLPKLARSVLCALITIDVHARDIISGMLHNEVLSVTSFEWLKQLRYYWDEDLEIVQVKMSSSSIEYGYEYLGASPRLVITPLTDRCYLCLMGALQLDLGGAPAGPAGTGKTETTKDLAKAISILCVVFNCSEGLDFRMMGRFFSGLAQSGAWCCFDEFNRIDIEVLSVIAQQLITIRHAKAQKLTRFMFEGREISLSPKCAAFITMNPGYAGRTELPDNLKALFRPISMMVPDYALIAEVILYSEGFESSKVLAKKMVQMYKLCSEQLSQQDHYDFGMRAVKSVLVMAGSLKRENPDKNEDVVLIRALRDSNLPKFLKDDAALFQGILSDLFPKVVIPQQDYGSLQTVIETIIKEKGLKVVPAMVKKIIQLYETMIVRHGVMLVGPTGGGKTTIYRVLQDSLTKLFDERIYGHYYKPVETYVLNPKSVTLGELYGDVNPATLEWHDGLLGIGVRLAAQCAEDIHQWIICDGPVDAVWIENMNTVLDDNKMLCLANSERIKLTPWVHMLFEVQDLAQASPATVSRCGMVYVDAAEIKWMPFFERWLSKLPENSFVRGYLYNIVKTYVEDGLIFVHNNCICSIEQVEIGKISMMCSLLDCFTHFLLEVEAGIDKPRLSNFVCQTFVFAYLWSIGGNLNDIYQEKFEVYVRDQFEEHPDARLPSSNDLWSYFMNVSNRRMELWQKITPTFDYSKSIPYFEILVPTIDTTRFAFLSEKLLSVQKPVLFTGQTGVGKSVIAKTVLKNMYESGDYVTITLNFSAQTSSGRTQEMIELKLEKKRKNRLGGPPGKQVVLFIDDINMPKLDTYGAQPPIELLRQYLDFGGMYDREKLFWKEIEDVVLMAACAPPGGGRNPLTPRFVRHFAMLNLKSPDEVSLKHIFKSILVGFFEEFTSAIQDMADSIVNAAVDIYARVCEDLLPTPAKSHYVYNLRDLSKCFQGVLQANSGSLREKDQMLRLFYHECLRVFHDRLINESDQRYFYEKMREVCSHNFFGIIQPLIEDEKGNFQKPWLMFGDFMFPMVDPSERVYEEITDITKLKSILQEYLDDYNVSSSVEMHLVFFSDAVEHIARVARILRSERGNALLIGVGGMGKQSLTRLGAQLCGYKCFMIELTRGYDYAAFHEDLRKLYMNAGAKNENTVFLFVDTQIVIEEFLEDINNILNSGEVPNLFEADEYEMAIQGVRPAAKKAGIAEGNRDAIFDYFIKRVRNNLHLVICMSPVGDSFRSRCRMFPSLVNCCTIDWFFEWPEEALLSVAFSSLNFIGKVEMREKIAASCVLMHKGVSEATTLLFNELKRKYYVTPGSYLEFIRLYKLMTENKTNEINRRRDRVRNGLMKLQETNELVAKMKKELIALEPELNKKNADTAALMKNLAVEQAEADKVRKVVMADEAVVKVKADETQAIAEDAQRDLDEALPALEAAQKALGALDKNDINEIRVFQKPPSLVKFVLEAVCLLLGAKTDWASAKVVLGDTNFLKRLQEYDKNKISEALLRKLKDYVDSPNFVPELVETHSKACKSLCMWVRAMDGYAKIFRVVEPKQKRFAQAEEDLNKIKNLLKEKQKNLAEVEAQIAELEAAYDKSLSEKMELERTIDLTATRLQRAGRLITALGDEEVRWEQSVKDFGVELENVTGNILISSAFVAYLGAFTSNYRVDLVNEWTKSCRNLKIPVSDNFSVINVLADPFEIRQWNTFGLPRDMMSVENGVLVTQTRKWPLMIDPQDQANLWIRQMEAENNLRRIKVTTPNFLKILEGCVSIGKPVLMEHVHETLEPSLDTILQKNTFKHGGRLLIRFGDTDIEYDPNFRFYMSTKLSNPHFLPEVCVKTTVINFTVTQSGLDDQLLSDVVRLERPDLEQQRSDLIIRINSDKQQLKAIEEKILKLLFTSEGNILDDEELIDTLNESKETAAIIASRLEQSEATEKKISIAREKYRSVSVRGAVMYFVVARLADIDPMYQYSLKYFNQLFNLVIETSEKSSDLEERLNILLDQTTLSVYTNVSRGLFEKHKLVFSFMLCCDILMNAGKLSVDYWNFLLRGPLSTNPDAPKKPDMAFLTDGMWNAVNFLEDNFPSFTDLRKNVGREITVTLGNFFQVIHISQSLSKSAIPWDKTLGSFEKLLLIKALKEEKLVFAITEFVKENLGKPFIESPPIILQSVYQDTSNVTPLIFVLTTGSDPFGSFQRFAQEMDFEDKIHSISLGQGQGPVAEKMINLGVQRGEWVFLQNCHLATSWMNSMEQIIQKITEEPEKVNTNFRLYLSSMPSKDFPVFVLQNSVKVTNEPPKGLRANVKRALMDMDPDFFEDNVLGMDWRRLVFGICFFHAIVQERKKFGPLAWNIVYAFSDSDRECALNNLKMFCADGIIPWDALEYITGEITYGGRVTDNWDQRCLSTVLKIFFSPVILEKGYKYSSSGIYYCPEYETLEEFRNFVEDFPILEEPEIFSMHSNANFIYESKETESIVGAILDIQPCEVSSSLGLSPDEIVFDMADEIRKRLVLSISKEKAHESIMLRDHRGRLPSLTTVVLQETDRFNKLLFTIHDSLVGLQKAIKGIVVMSEALEAIYKSFINNQVPTLWSSAGYPSVKGLAAWTSDLELRINFISTWLRKGVPNSFWLPGFFFPQGFLTGALQTHARKYDLPIDQLTFTFTVLKVFLEQEEIDQQLREDVHQPKTIYKQIVPPEDGVNIHGLFIDAARWDVNSMLLTDPLPGEMNPPLPAMLLLPKESNKIVDTQKRYVAPLYKTPLRAGVLSTTGHSTNFIMPVLLPTSNPSSYWILRGAALITQTLDV
ncbi:dynein axonemal heavy chain 6 [Ischnura elegans]|uniref:dynein axonemal heavy chain 6 n=1 Tax=Ischnura elegans TaxID=197161 RepID=UPI001ED86A73|nr:dynein axonemal heavy chain 6 [Ischnura elegans]